MLPRRAGGGRVWELEIAHCARKRRTRRREKGVGVCLENKRVRVGLPQLMTDDEKAIGPGPTLTGCPRLRDRAGRRNSSGTANSNLAKDLAQTCELMRKNQTKRERDWCMSMVSLERKGVCASDRGFYFRDRVKTRRSSFLWLLSSHRLYAYPQSISDEDYTQFTDSSS